MALIDASDDFSLGRNYPDDDGFEAKNDFSVLVGPTTGTVISATLQVKDGEAGWLDVPTTDSSEIISGSYFKSVRGGNGLYYRINVPSAPTGNWAYSFHINDEN